jgi:hypothetical protein
MRAIPKVTALMLAGSLLLPVTVLAKRIPAPVIEPIVHTGIRYTVPNDRGTVGYVVAVEAATGKELWRKTIFRKMLNPILEHDVQWVFIKQMRLDGERLLLVSEEDKMYSLDLKTRKVKKVKGRPQARQGSNPDAGPFQTTNRSDRTALPDPLRRGGASWLCVEQRRRLNTSQRPLAAYC